MSKRTLGRVGACAAAVAGAVLAPATVAPALPARPAQDAYDGHLEEANAWAVEALNLPAAWETTRGEGVTIAVIDTGVAEHPYFGDKEILPGHSAYSDDEEDAWYDRPTGGDPALDGADIEDKQGHGTAVISQVLLAAPEATILPVRTGTGVADGFSNLFGDGATDIEAVRWAVDNGADAIVMAWGIGSETNEDVYMAMQYAVDHDVVLIASAGNDPEVSTTGQFPAFLRGVVTVGGLAADGGPWASSTTGPEVDLAAPADFSLAVPVPQGSPHAIDGCTLCDDSSYGADGLYMEVGGTSLSVGWVGGVVALIESAHPDLDANGVIQRLLQTAADRGDPGRDDVFGHGVPDAAAAIGADVEPVDENPLGYPLGVPGASGASASGAPAPGTGATTDGATTGSGTDAGGSDLGPFAVVVLAAAVIAAGAWFGWQKRRSGPASPGGVAATPLGTGALVALVVAMVASTGAYVAADVVVGKEGSDETTAAPAADGGSDESADAADPAGEAGEAGAGGQLAADGNPAATAAQAWHNAYTAGDLEGFRSLTCENPWYRVAINLKKLEDPGFVRPGFAILIQQEGGYWGPEDYRLTRQSDGKAWVAAGNLSIGSDADYELALVLESGEWKVCDFWWAKPGWHGIPEWEQRFPRDDDSVGLSGLQER